MADGSQSDCRSLTDYGVSRHAVRKFKQIPTVGFELGSGVVRPFIQRSDEPVSICK